MGPPWLLEGLPHTAHTLPVIPRKLCLLRAGLLSVTSDNRPVRHEAATSLEEAQLTCHHLCCPRVNCFVLTTGDNSGGLGLTWGLSRLLSLWHLELLKGHGGPPLQDSWASAPAGSFDD